MNSKLTVWLTAIGSIIGCVICWWWLNSFPNGIGLFGSIASVIGLVLTAYVTHAVRQIRGRYVRKVLLKECLNSLNDYRLKLDSGIRQNDFNSVRENISRAIGILNGLGVHVAGNEKIKLEAKIRVVVQDLESVVSEDNRRILALARTSLSKLQTVTEELKLLLIEHEWGDHND